MSPVETHEGEDQYYSSPIIVKSQQYTVTLTSERLIIEGRAAPREFKIRDIVGAYPITLPSNEPGLKIVFSTKNGHKEMVWSVPVGDISKAGEQQVWADQIQKAIGDKSAVVPALQPAPLRAVPTAVVSSQSAVYFPGELRLILQDATGQIGREFAIAELMDASWMESESGEPSVVLTIGSQTGVKQMILTFPSLASCEAWMVQLSAKLPAHVMPPPPMMPQMLTLQPGEKTFMSSPGVRVKRSSFTAYLTNTRFVLMGNTNGMLAIAGEFAVNAL